MIGTTGRLGWRVSQQVLNHSHARLLSTVNLQNVRLCPRRDRRVVLHAERSRSFWWSSSKAPSPQEQLLETTATPEQPPVETATLVETTNATGAAPVSGTEPPLVDSVPSLDASTGAAASSTSLDVALPDVSAVTSIPIPMQYGDLAALGLAGWTPAGITRWSMELLHVTAGLPWFWTIVGVTVLSRVILLPFTIKSLQNTARLAPYQDEMLRIRDQMSEAQKTRNVVMLQSAALKQQMIYKKCGVSMASMALMPFIQLPVTLGMFFGVKKLCDLPVEQLKYSGLEIWPDLTVADPTYVLPVVATAMINLQLRAAMADMAPAPHTAHLINAFRVLSIVGVFFMIKLPVGVMAYLITSISCILLQTLVMRIPAVRKAFGIPVVPPHMESKGATFKESLDYVKQWWKDKKEEQEAVLRERERLNRRK